MTINDRKRNLLTEIDRAWYIYTMETISDTLRRLIHESGQSHKGIEKACNVNRLSIGRFMRGISGLRQDQIDLLALHFGVELKKTGDNK